MATNNAINSLDPIQVALGGTGDSTLTANGVLYGNGTAAIGVTSVGTAGQVLTSNQVSAPTFQTITGASGALVLLQTQTVSGASSVVFNTGITSTYNNYYILYSNVSGTSSISNITGMGLQVSANGGSSYVNSGYIATCSYFSGGSFVVATTNSTTGNAGAFLGVNLTSTFSYSGYSGYGWIYSLTSGDKVTTVTAQSTSPFIARTNSLVQGSIAVFNALRIFTTSTFGTTTISGTFSLYGVKG